VKIGSWTWMTVLGLACWALVPEQCNAQSKCPWLNAATAAGLLGGEVQLVVTPPVDPGKSKGAGAAMYSEQLRMDRYDVSCDFSRKTDTGARTLSIVVKTMTDPGKEFASFLALCTGSTVAQKGIGNEAVQCVWKDNSHPGYEQVIARARDRAFVLTLHRDAASHPAPDSGELSPEARNVAEQVAGSLF
jgi:hypothetical protein